MTHRARPRHLPPLSAALLAGIALVLLTPAGVAHTISSAPISSGSGAVGPGITPSPSTHPQVHPTATSVTLVPAGDDPTAVALSWSPTHDGCFVSYTVEWATNGVAGPWSTAEVVVNAATTTYVAEAQLPGATTLWKVVDRDCLGTADSNVLTVVQPAAPVLRYTAEGTTGAVLTWNNPATYRGFISFSSYALEQSVGNGLYEPVGTAFTAATGSFTLTGLSPTSSYSFYLEILDQCCAEGQYWASVSNVVTFGAVVGLAVAVPAVGPYTEAGIPQVLTAFASGGVAPYNYSWTFGDGVIGAGQSAEHTYAAGGHYSVTCTVADHVGDQATYSFLEAIDPAPTVAIDRPFAELAPGDAEPFLAAVTYSGTVALFQFQWIFGDGTTAMGPEPTHTFTAPGNYVVTVVLTDDLGSTTVAVAPVTVAVLAAATMESAAAVVTGVLLTLSASASGGAGAPYDYQWAFGDGEVAGGASVQHTYAQPGAYAPVVLVGDAYGNVQRVPLSIITVALPESGGITASTASSAPGVPVVLTANGSGGFPAYTCAWAFGDGAGATGCSSTHAWSSPGHYEVRVTVVDSIGDRWNGSVNVTVAALPAGSSAWTDLSSGGGASPLAVLLLGIAVVGLGAVLVRRARGPRRPPAAADRPA